MHIREEDSSDLAAIRDVGRRAFGDEGDLIADLVDALREDSRGTALSLVAVDDESGEVVGHTLFTRGYLDAPRRLVDVGVLSPLSVVPERQRRGIGGALIREGLARLGAAGVPAVFLEGSPDYYARHEFAAGEPLGFGKPSPRIPDAAFQVALLPAYEPWMTGALVYPETFWRFDAVGLRDAAA